MQAHRLVGTALLLIPAPASLVPAGATVAQDAQEVLQDYLSRVEQRAAVVASVEEAFGKTFDAFSEQDYARFLEGLDLEQEQDLWTWSHLTGVPLVGLSQGADFFGANAHLLADADAARRIPTGELGRMESRYREGTLTVTGSGGEDLALREDAAEAMRPMGVTGQIRHNRDFAGDRTRHEYLSPYLVRLGELDYRAELERALEALPLSIVRVLRGKALYLTTLSGGRCDTVSHCMSCDLHADFAGMQPGVILERDPAGRTAENLVRGLAGIVRETVLPTQYFGIYAYPLQFPAFHRLEPQRRRVFGRRRDELPQTPHGYVNERARRDAQENFAEHLTAYLLDRRTFQELAERQAAQGHPELLRKFEFMRTLVLHTSTAAEPLSREHLARFDAAEQREIMNEYLARQAASRTVRAQVEDRFGKPFPEFTLADYSEFMRGLDLDLDDDLWTWLHVTDIPVVGLNKRSNFFHMNAHLLADVGGANLMSWYDLSDLVTRFDRETGEIRVSSKETGLQYEVRDLPAGTVRRLETTEDRRHNAGWEEDRITYEALEFCLVRLGDLENRAELNAAIRMLPLPVVQAHRGKAIYPTTRSRTGWAFTWRVGNEDNLSYAGMVPGSLAERRRDSARARVSPDELVENGLDSLRGNSCDSVIHEVGHVIDLNVIGARNDHRAHPFQFPRLQELAAQRRELFEMTAEKGTGYVSAYSKVNPQENFAEHFWAYLRDPEDFLARATAEAAGGADLLLRKYRFMERLIEGTPPTMHRLSPQYLELEEQWLEQAMAREREHRIQRQEEVLAWYLEQRAGREEVVARVERRFGKPFHEFTREDYAQYLSTLDLERDEDVLEWSHVTRIPVLALARTSSFFSSNTHLLEDVEAALRMTARESYTLKTEVDGESRTPVVRDAAGEVLPLRALPEGILQPTGRTEGFWHFEDFRAARTVHEVLAPYLLRLEDLPYRDALGGWLRTLPLSVVQVYRGKGLYFTPLPGRSYAPTMPCSNTTYKSNVGMQTGLWVEIRSGPLEGTAQNFVHEFGHIVDYVILKGGYGSYRAPHQFPEFRKLLPDKQRVFGVRDDKVPRTPYGYVSRYAATNAQESFAEHFRAYITERDAFHRKAEEEATAGHPELMQKYHFMQRLVDGTPTTMRRLSPGFLAQDARWTETRARITRLREAQRLLGEKAPEEIERLIEVRLAAAFGEGPPREEDALAKKVVRAVGAVADRKLANRALATILGITLDLVTDRGATAAAPSFTATLRGADEGALSGTLEFGTLVRRRFGSPPAPTDIELAAGASQRVSWNPDTGEDLAPFVAVATAELTWNRRRFVLSREVACRPSIPAWSVVGPFDNPGGAGADIEHPPETEVDLSASYPGQGGERIGWQPARRPSDSRLDTEFVLDFAELLGPAENAAAYAVVWVRVPRTTDALLSLGSADGAVVWINGERQFAWLEGRRDYRSGTDRVPIRLKRGRNEILVKVTLTAKGWKLGAHLTDTEGRPIEGIRYSLEP